MDQLPIRFSQLFTLSQPPLSIPANQLGLPTVGLQSDKFISVREETPAGGNVVIIDVNNWQNPERRSVKADSAIVNPVDKILALRAGTTLQVFKLTAQPVPVGNHVMTEPVEFWKWISPTVIAIVTAKAVYHWNLAKAGEAPAQVFARLPILAGHQIINYHANHDHTWLALVGIASDPATQRVVGHIQLYSTEKSISQPIEGHAAAFTTLPGTPKPSTLFCFASRNNPADPKLFIGEVGGSPTGHRVSGPIFFPETSPLDFPVALEVSEKYKVVYMLTKDGYFHLYDLKQAKRITINKVSQDTVFTACPYAGSGIMAINKAGQVLTITLNEATIINYILNQLKDPALALAVASVSGLTNGIENIAQQNFQQLFQTGQYAEAARAAAESPGGILRTAVTINMFKNLPTPPGTVSPLLNYFTILLEKGTLNVEETMELARPVLLQGRKDLFEQWLTQNKLSCTEQLGDLVRQLDARLALDVYTRANAKNKVVALYAEMGQFDALVAYCKAQGFQPNWLPQLQAVIATNPTAATNFAKMLLLGEGGPLVDVNAVVDLFMQRQLVKETTSILLDVLAPNRPEDAALQTRLLEINLKAAPRVAMAIFENKMFTHYDKQKIALLCEQAGLTNLALQHATNITDVKRLLTSGRGLTADFVVAFFAKLNLKETLECLTELLRSNPQQNLDLVVAISVKYTPPPTAQPDAEHLSPAKVIALFEELGLHQGTYLYLKQIAPIYKTNKDIVFKFIESAAKLEQIKDIETAVREYEYDPERVKEFLKQARLSDQLPLIILCDKFNFVSDLTHYLCRNNMFGYVETYVLRHNPVNTPAVVGALLDENFDEEKIRALLQAVGHLCPADALVEEVEKRNKLKMLRPWLEARFAEGNREPALHNALAKILVQTNDDRKEQFLMSNEFYDSRVVGAYCENHDPRLAFIAYKRGRCHSELINSTNKHGLFREQAKYLVEEQSPDLWAYVLREDNEYRGKLIDQVVQSALPETKRAELVSVVVKAFMTANLPNELIELLDKIVLESNNDEFRNNRILQNLLLLTAIRADKSRVMDYVNRLDGYNPPEIAKTAIEAGLFEEAFVIYKKCKLNVEAVTVLIVHLHNLERAVDFAEACGEGPVYSRLGQAQLEEGHVSEAISSFLKAEDPEFHEKVIDAAHKAGLFEELGKYLKMCRKKLRKERIDSELAFCLAKTDRRAELEEFISSPNVASVQDVGDKCFEQELYEAAKILFANNQAKLASTLVRLGDFAAAVEAARRANSVATWREVHKACVDAKRFNYANIAGSNLIIHPDELNELVQYYEVRGHSEELMALLEGGLGLERAHTNMFTELAILYSKYKPSKLGEHIKLFRKRLIVQKVCQACKDNRQWHELAFLYELDNEFDKAIRIMIEHPAEAFDDLKFRELIVKVTTVELYYEAIKFYLEQQPDQVNDLLAVLSPKIDHGKVVDRVRKLQHLPIIKKYLVSVQEKNLVQVNDALNELYIEEEDFEALRHSVDSYDNFDSISLSRKLEKHPLLEFRRIAAHLYKQNKRYKQSIDISKQNKLYKDCMETAADSKDQAIAEDLLHFFLEQNLPHCFAATLFTCYDLVRPDVVLELAWKHQLMDYIFPYLIQYVREYTSKVDTLVAKQQEQQTKPAESAHTTPAGVPPGAAAGHPPPFGVAPPPGYVIATGPPAFVPPGVPPGAAVVPPGFVPPGYPPPGFPVLGLPPPAAGGQPGHGVYQTN